MRQSYFSRALARPHRLGLALVALMALAVLPVSAQTPPQVAVVAVKLAAVGSGFEMDGVVQPVKQSTVSAQASGRIVTLASRRATRCVPASCWPPSMTVKPRPACSAAGRRSAQAQAELRNAQANFDRTRELLAQGFVSKAAMDTADAQLKSAQAGRDQASAGEKSVGLSQGFTRVTAPFDAFVLQTLSEAGDLAFPGKPLLTLYAPMPLRAVVQVPVSRSALVQGSALVEVQVRAADGSLQWIRPSQTSHLPTADAVSQTIEWRLELPASASNRIAAGSAGAGALCRRPVAAFADSCGSGAAPGRVDCRLCGVGPGLCPEGDSPGCRTMVPQGVEVLAGLSDGRPGGLGPGRAGLAGAQLLAVRPSEMSMSNQSTIGYFRAHGAGFQANAITPLLALVALLLGLFAVLVTPREEEPQINVTMANVLIPFPGASSADVHNMVARPAEQVLSQIAGIEHTYSVARPGLAVMTVQFKVGVPRTEALVRLYDVLNANQDWLPRDLGTLTPIVKPKGIDDVPVLAVTLWSKDALPAVDLERVAHTLEAELKRVPGTREVQTIGGPDRAVHVWLDPVRLRERGVDVLSLKATLAAANCQHALGRRARPASVWRSDAERGNGRIFALGARCGRSGGGRQQGPAGVPAGSGAYRDRRAIAAALCLVHARGGGRWHGPAAAPAAWPPAVSIRR